jgi:hypothetical protein
LGYFDVNITIDKEYILGGTVTYKIQTRLVLVIKDEGVVVNTLKDKDVNLAFCSAYGT